MGVSPKLTSTLRRGWGGGLPKLTKADIPLGGGGGTRGGGGGQLQVDIDLGSFVNPYIIIGLTPHPLLPYVINYHAGLVVHVIISRFETPLSP